MRHRLTPLMIAIALSVSLNVNAGDVTRAIFTIGIDNREPVSEVESVNSRLYEKISFFTELTDLQGHTITHQWTYQDKIIFEKSFEVKGDRWRVWTSKSFLPEWSGTWTVNILDTDRSVLDSRSFLYQ